MSATNRDKCIAITLDYEGGNVDDPRDPGGRTSRGVTAREYAAWRLTHPGLNTDVFRAPQATIVEIYRQRYWNPISGDQWPDGLDLVNYDAGVNSGPGAALRWARSTFGQPALGFPQLAAIGAKAADKVSLIRRYQANRLAFLHALGTWAYFGRGWARRVAGIEALAMKMALLAVGKPPVTVQAELNAEGAKAAQKSNGAAGGAAAGSAAGGGQASQVDWTSWLDIAAGVAVGLLMLALVVWMVHVWHVQRERALALKGIAAQ